MSEPVYISKVRIERDDSPIRRAYLPAEDEPVVFGIHGDVASHYGVDPSTIEPRAASIDYLVAAAAG